MARSAPVRSHPEDGCAPSTSGAVSSCSGNASTVTRSQLSRPSQLCGATRRRVVAAASADAHSGDGVGKVGVVIVDHGSRKKASNAMLDEFGALYSEITGEEIVEVAHMEIAKPSIADAVARCAERGASTVVIAPYFLSRGRHIQEDIPHLVEEAQKEHPGLRCIIADPIGIDPLMVRLISNRVAEALEQGGSGKAAVAAVTASGHEATA
ncbi:hypothetical protein HYH03_002000 [Edaphochlamys debaryana]|uniref:Sirohydrochlorin cobaltochelatase n=1 Tax=Edaphochlamys debaryana TaxID=47281 RepID=A0A835YD60_9CHLO|nr:hypothetical protein HYH03_002000 [Edaphochlamys debaryana]|eukprot:KAG2500431.1 hypothetical protein HYH03_002000 [Edaphochlamys debaryana]